MGRRKRGFDDIARRTGDHLPTVAANQPSETEKECRTNAKLRSVPVFKLQPHPLQPLERHSEQNVADLLVSIIDLGLQEPPLVWRRPDGSYVILIGHRRVRAWQLGALDGRLDHKIRVFVREDLTDGEALKRMAVEYFHRIEYSNLHIARLVGETSKHLSLDQNGQISTRDLAAVLPWGKTSVDHYLTIYRGLQDPRMAPLVHRADKAPISLLCKMLTLDEFSTRVDALKAYAEKGTAAAQEVVKAAKVTSQGGRPLKTVTRKERRGGYDLTIRIRPTMTAAQVEEALQALDQAEEDLKTMPREVAVRVEE